MAGRDLGEADLAGDLGDALLVAGKAVAVHGDDGDGTEPLLVGGGERLARLRLVERPVDAAVGHQPFVDLHHLGVELFGQDDVAGEDVGTILVADSQTVAETAGDGQHGGRALALEERVGGDRGAHLDGVDARGRDRLLASEAEDVADPLQGGIRVLFGVLREQLVDADRTVRRPRHHVGEGAAAIDPELPAVGHRRYPPPREPRGL